MNGFDSGSSVQYKLKNTSLIIEIRDFIYLLHTCIRNKCQNHNKKNFIVKN